MRHLSSICFQDKRLQDAAGYLHRALTLSKETKNQHSTALVLYNLGQLVAALGNYDQAQIFYLESLAISELLDDESFTETILTEVVATNLNQGNYVVVDDYSNRLLALLEKHEETSQMVATLRNAATELLKKGELYRAESYIQRAIKIEEKKSTEQQKE